MDYEGELNIITGPLKRRMGAEGTGGREMRGCSAAGFNGRGRDSR